LEKNSKKTRTLAIAGGGTGGHVAAGLAIAASWKAKYGREANVFFVGTKGGMESKLVPEADIDLDFLTVGRLNRVGLFEKIRTLSLLGPAFVHAFLILVKRKPCTVIGVGGYASGPLVLVASLFRAPLNCHTAILEQNSVPGMTNRILGKYVDQIFVAFAETGKFFKGKSVQHVGNPIRNTIVKMPPASNSPLTLLIVGGSQGAIGINTLIIESLFHLKGLPIRFIHQTGEADFDRVKQAHKKHATDHQVHSYIRDMTQAYREASLVISRAGSSTLFEVAAASRASILIPLPTAANNHQEINAKFFESQGASRVLNQLEATGQDLADEIKDLLEQFWKVTEMEKRAIRLHLPHAADNLVKDLF